MTRAIHLLGPPRVTVDGAPAPAPRGRKAWALLTYLVVTRAPVPRERLASLLFTDAEDPLGALRWNLTQVRKVIGEGGALGGSPVRLALPPDTTIDLHALASGSVDDALHVPGLGHELLEGLSFAGCPAFEAWLLNERRHVEGLASAALHEGALSKLAAGDVAATVALATRLVTLEPFHDAGHELLIRAYAAGGDRDRATQHLAACVEEFRRHLGRDPAPGVVRAVDAEAPQRVSRPVSGSASVRAGLDAGEAAIAAGAVDAGLEMLRRAAAEGRTCGDDVLRVRAAIALADALTWTTRGTEEEIAGTLHEAVALARRAGESATAARALFQLGFLEMMHGRYERSNRWLDEVEAERDVPDHRLGRTQLQRVWNFIDVGRYRSAADRLARAAGMAQATGDQELEAMCLGEEARIAILAGDPSDARELLERSLVLTRRVGRASYLAYPLTLLGRVALAEGALDEAHERFEQAFALGMEQGDPCWQALGLTGLGLVAEARGEPDAVELCHDGVCRTGGVLLHWSWVHAWAQHERASVAIAAGDPRALGWVDELESLTSRTGMHDLLARAHLHRHALGDRSALGAASLVAASVESPRLAADIAAAAAPKILT